MAVDVSLLVVLLVCWGGYWTQGQVAVSINVSYTPPPGFTPGPNEYRAASGPVAVTCTATGAGGTDPDDDYTYQWTSTCINCPFQMMNSMSMMRMITRTAVTILDDGTHTCTATRVGQSASGSADTVFNIVGAGIFFATGTGPTGSQSNNGLARPSDTTAAGARRLRFFCRSDSTMAGVGDFLGLDGTAITSGSVFDISTSNRGEVDVNSRVGPQDPLTADEQGVYTCRIPLESGDIREINIGIYPFGFTAPPTITNPLVFASGSSSSTLTCTSSTSVATTVTFRRGGTTVGVVRDGDSVPGNGVTYQLAQTVNSRAQSTYQNVLTITEPLSSLAGSSFTCQVENVLGMSVTSQAFVIPELSSLVSSTFTCQVGNALGPSETSDPSVIPGLEISTPPQTVTVGDTVTYTCTSLLGPATIEWQDVDNGDTVLEMASGVTELTLMLGPVSQNMDGNRYRCSVSIGTPIFDDVTLTIQAPSVTATLDISGSGVIGGSVTFTCDVTGLSSLASDTGIVVTGPRGLVGSGTGASLQVTLNPAVISDAGRYTCAAIITSTLLNDDSVMDSDTADLTLRIPDPSVSVTRDGGTPLLAGIVLTLTCEITVTGIQTSMLSNVDVSTTWIGAGGNPLSTGGRITVTDAVQVSGTTTYISTVVFDTLITGNQGTYTCQANINPTGSFLTASNGVDANIIIPAIQFPTLALSAVSSTTRLPDVAPYNTFSLTCTATAPEGVVALKTFTWRRAESAGGTCAGFAVVSGNIDNNNLEQPVSTSVLNVTETDAAILRFCCQASVAGVSGTPNNVLSIDVVGPADPMQPTNLRVSNPGATTVTVQWTVSLIAYTPETYVVSYSTGTLKRQVMMSGPVGSGADFDAVNQTFTAELTGLSPDTAYNYLVMSNNTEGTTASEPQSLTTMADGGGGGGSNGGAIAGGIIGAIIAIGLIVLIIILAVWLRRRRRTADKAYALALSPRNTASQEPTRYTRPTAETAMEKTIAPVIQEFPENDMTFLEGEGLSFAVQVAGVPTPSIVWYQDGKELVSDYSLEIAGDGSLTIHSVEPRHGGTYKLVVTNQAGSMDKTVKVSVLPEAEATPSAPRRQQQDVTAIPVAEFGKYVATNHANNNRGFQDLYGALYSGDEHPVALAKSAKNRPLNRFANITVYDDHRILLQPLPGRSDCQRDYVNASYIDGYSIPKKFIATQGPLPKTNVDFWRLVWQERPPSIVMVTNLREGNKIKCQQYWPESGKKKFGPFEITITDQQTFADYVIRTFGVSLVGSSERPLKVTQFHFTAWPDHGVPEYATPILTFHRRVISQHTPSRGPLLVHCSAGVGRTGTFITVDCVLEQLEREQVIDISGTINRIRQQRMKLVQTAEQFSFVHDAVLESVTCGDTQIAATDFRFAIRKLEGRDPQTRQTGFESQFQVLHQVSPKPDEVRRDAAIRHRDMNRSTDYLPPDQYRVVLKGEVPDYIHAISANGYKQQKAFIIAENPMESSCRNFWKMLYSRKCAAIVMLSRLVENGQEVCYQYWPMSGVKQFGEFTVDLLGEEKLEGFVLRTLSVLDTKSGKAHQITQFHIVNWTPDGHCSNLKTVTDIIEEVGKVQRKTGNHPVAIHCSDTVCRSGMFCSIATTIERCKTEGVVDVFQVVKALRVQKPGAVLTEAQYQQVFEAVLVYLESFDTYANFQNI